jgi:hypothetical protein
LTSTDVIVTCQWAWIWEGMIHNKIVLTKMS